MIIIIGKSEISHAGTICEDWFEKLNLKIGAEIKIFELNQLNCLVAYKDSIVVEVSCLEIYSKSQTNDESDSCRHFVWAILLSKNLSPEEAKNLLDAHENNPKEPLIEKAMDLSNNRLGLAEYQRLSKDGEVSKERIIDAFKQNLKKNSLIIISPKYSQNGGLP